ncbi:hypothetical protein [Mesorhizobium sp. CA5]|nr:hypothetical protein [Mesorhizobium sp. CA5]MBZ9841903.1 hypothetical protein [Mesorhizobium sp. CA5]
MAAAKGLLVKVRGDGAGLSVRGGPPRIGGIEAEPILSLPADASAGTAAAGDRGATWLRLATDAADTDNPWDHAHDLVARNPALAAAGAEVLAIEPDIVQQWD